VGRKESHSLGARIELLSSANHAKEVAFGVLLLGCGF